MRLFRGVSGGYLEGILKGFGGKNYYYLTYNKINNVMNSTFPTKFLKRNPSDVVDDKASHDAGGNDGGDADESQSQMLDI